MYYKCQSFKVKDASGDDIEIQPINVDNGCIIHVNELRGTITVYPNVESGAVRAVIVNRTPIYVISGGSLEITEGQAYDNDWITFTDDPYPESN